MKKWIALALALVLCLSLGACSSDTSAQDDLRPNAGVDASDEVTADNEPDREEDDLRPSAGVDGSDEVTADNETDHEEDNQSGVTSSGEENRQEVVMPEYVYSSSLDVYSISQESFLRAGGKSGDLSELSADEYYSPVLHLQYNGQGQLSWSELSVRVDGGEAWYWSAGSLRSGQSMDLHVFYSNMQHMAEGSHTIAWYMDGTEIYSDHFLLTHDLDWASLTDLPTASEIAAYTNPNNARSPYMAFWFSLSHDVHYTEYTIDFKADYFPLGSYCSLGNWYMDYPVLEQRYQDVSPEYGISGYAGFQNIASGEHIGIMSFWDLYCTDAAGNVTTLRAEQTYPENPYHTGEFGGEGVGAQCLEEYDWQENHWYRVHLRCVDSAVTGNTEVEFWVCDLETMEYTKICAFDVGTPGATFQGGMAIFLENYLPEYAGEIRTLEVCNVNYLDAATGQWCALTEGDMLANGSALTFGYEGSYDYGVEGDRLWIMTTGVGSNQDDSAGSHLKFGN